ncbi:hypothetical protein [Neobacillus sp. PS3-40]|nr:hypothetical protein [Neobacillus sp. PS3-40]WML44585.1 hypothetical protein RCG20_01330 [Neobacillus sp. PS3-40]
MKFDNNTLKGVTVIALVAIAIGTGFSALWLAQIVDLLSVLANK